MLKTVAELITALQQFPPETDVVCCWDTMPDWPIHRIDLYEGKVVIDCNAIEGDWDALEYSRERPNNA